MPSDSVESFLELAREHRLLPTDRLDQLLERSEVPQENLGEVCDTLVNRGLLTPFQASRIRDGRRNELTFAGYAVLDRQGDCPGGHVLKARHPSLRSPILIRRIQTDWLTPVDNLSAYIQRAKQASTITHTHLATILEAGTSEEDLFVVLEPLDGSDLESLVRDIGPMPTFLGCLYIRQAASALAGVTHTDLAHGDIQPANLTVSPLVPSSRFKPDGTPLYRPGPASTVKVTEFGLIPLRPPLQEWVQTRVVSPKSLAYLAPERLADGAHTEAGDVYGLGLSLYYLLTARTPFVDETTAGMLAKIGSNQPLPLEALRPDVPPALIELFHRMIAKNPTQRPRMAEVVDQLAKFIAPNVATLPAPPPQTPAESSILGGSEPITLTPDHQQATTPLRVATQITPLLHSEPVDLTPAVTADEWTVTPFDGSTGDNELMFAPAAEKFQAVEDEDRAAVRSSRSVPTRKRGGMTQEEVRHEKRKWFMIALGLWILSIPLWIILLYQWGVIGGGTKPADVKPTIKRK